MNDLIGIGKIAEVILNKISAATGTLYQPTHIKKMEIAKAEGEAQALLLKTEAEMKADIIRRNHQYSIENQEVENKLLSKRAAQRLITQELNRQKNLEAIISESITYAEINNSNNFTECEVEYDWIETFLRYAKDISDNDIRRIWSKILSSQATDGMPNVSKVTLDALRLIEKHQAYVLEKAIQLYMAIGQIMDIEPLGREDIAFNMNELGTLALEDIGFLKLVSTNTKGLMFHDKSFTFWKEYASIGNSQLPQDQIYWNTTKNRGAFLKIIYDISENNKRDVYNLRHEIQIDRLLLTSRGFELAAIIFPDFYALLDRNNCDADYSQLGPYSDVRNRTEVLKIWAKELSSMGVVVVLNNLKSIDPQKKESGGIKLIATHIFDKKIDDWVSIQ